MNTNPTPPTDSGIDNSAFANTLALAREHRPDTSAAEFGFGTRLAARISALRREGEAPGRSWWDEATTWLWGGAAGAAPVVVALAVWFFVAHGLDVHLQIDTSFDSLFDQLSAYLPSFSSSGN